MGAWAMANMSGRTGHPTLEQLPHCSSCRAAACTPLDCGAHITLQCYPGGKPVCAYEASLAYRSHYKFTKQQRCLLQ